MTNKKRQTEAGATELTEEELSEAQGGQLAINFSKVQSSKKTTTSGSASPEGPYKRK